MKNEKSNLVPPDTFHLSAAVGWLELGNPREAYLEISKISEPFQEEPVVLEVRWSIAAAVHDWAQALEIAQKLVEVAPALPLGWIHQAYALRRVPGGDIQKAEALLQVAALKFPENTTIHYNLACYAAQLQRLDEAWERLHKAMEVEGDIERIKKMALADSDLKPLWKKIKNL